MKKRAIFLAICALLCGSTAVASTIPDDQFALGGVKIGTSMEYVMSVYGNPLETNNIAHPEEDSLYKSLTYYRYGDKKFPLVLGTVTGSDAVRYIRTDANNGWNPPSGITVGMKDSDVEKAYGKPDEVDSMDKGKKAYYYFNSSGTEFLAFGFENHKVIAIELVQPIPRLSKPQMVYYTIPYIKGPVQLSPSVFTLHIGERIHLAPSPNSVDPGRVRFMSNGPGSFQIVDTQSAGRQDSRTNTELIITGKKVGTAQFKIVPDYGDWPRAATITIHVIP